MVHDTLRKFGPMPPDGQVGNICPACKQPFKEGDYTTLIAIGPGDDPESQERARHGKAYNAVAVQVHWSCATGDPS